MEFAGYALEAGRSALAWDMDLLRARASRMLRTRTRRRKSRAVPSLYPSPSPSCSPSLPCGGQVGGGAFPPERPQRERGEPSRLS